MKKIYLLDDLCKILENDVNLDLCTNTIRELIDKCINMDVKLLNMNYLISLLGDQLVKSGILYDEIIVLGTDGYLLAKNLYKYIFDNYNLKLYKNTPIHINIKRITDNCNKSTIYSTGIEGYSLIDEIKSKKILLENKKVLMLDDVLYSGNTIITVIEFLSLKSKIDLGLLLKMDYSVISKRNEMSTVFNNIFSGYVIFGMPQKDLTLLNTKDLIDPYAYIIRDKSSSGEIEYKNLPFYKIDKHIFNTIFTKNPKLAQNLCYTLAQQVNIQNFM